MLKRCWLSGIQNASSFWKSYNSITTYLSKKMITVKYSEHTQTHDIYLCLHTVFLYYNRPNNLLATFLPPSFAFLYFYHLRLPSWMMNNQKFVYYVPASTWSATVIAHFCMQFCPPWRKWFNFWNLPFFNFNQIETFRGCRSSSMPHVYGFKTK